MIQSVRRGNEFESQVLRANVSLCWLVGLTALPPSSQTELILNLAQIEF